jgi:futalosine hydrolase
MKPKNILLVVATEMEIPGMFEYPGKPHISAGTLVKKIPGLSGFNILITGPGIPATMFFLAGALKRASYDLAINAGIAGSFRDDLPPGTAVNVVRDCFPELGADHKERFIPLYGMEMAEPYLPPFINAEAEINCGIPCLKGLPAVKGITVNTISTHPEKINELRSRTKADIESMEGAAFFWCCRSHNIPCLQIRVISNLITPGHLSQWDVPLAVTHLETTLKEVLDELR